MAGISPMTSDGSSLRISFALYMRSSSISKAPATTTPRAKPMPSPIPQNFRRFGNSGLCGKLGGSTTRNRSPCCSSSMLVAILDSFFFFRRLS